MKKVNVYGSKLPSRGETLCKLGELVDKADSGKLSSVASLKALWMLAAKVNPTTGLAVGWFNENLSYFGIDGKILSVYRMSRKDSDLGRKIEAIKYYRTFTDCSLREAKNAVESILESYGEVII